MKKLYNQPEVLVSRMVAASMMMAGSGGGSDSTPSGIPESGNPDDAI